MSNSDFDTRPRDDDDEGPQVSTVDLITWVGERKGFIATATIVSTAIAAAIAFSLPTEYTARASVLSPQQQGSGAAAAALSALGALGGLAGSLGAKTPDELYLSLLNSESVLRGVNSRFKLQQRYESSSFESLKHEIREHVRIVAEKKTGVISIEVDDPDPAFAADLANAYVAELRHVLDRLAVTDAQQRRDFYEKQLAATKENLIKADQAFQKLQEQSGAIMIDRQADALLSTMGQVRARIAEREVQLRVLRSSATDANPEVQRVLAEIRGLRTELQRMEGDTNARGRPTEMSANRLPALAGEYLRARREVKYQELLLESLLKQFELARLDVAKEGPALQSVDTALPPDYKSKPKRVLIVLAGFMLGLLGASTWVAVRRYQALSRELDPQTAGAWAAMKRAWGLRNGRA